MCKCTMRYYSARTCLKSHAEPGKPSPHCFLQEDLVQLREDISRRFPGVPGWEPETRFRQVFFFAFVIFYCLEVGHCFGLHLLDSVFQLFFTSRLEIKLWKVFNRNYSQKWPSNQSWMEAFLDLVYFRNRNCTNVTSWKLSTAKLVGFLDDHLAYQSTSKALQKHFKGMSQISESWHSFNWFGLALLKTGALE